MRYALGILAGAMLLAAPGVQAARFLPGDDLVETREPVEDDLFAAGDTVSIQHHVRDDVFAAGNKVFIEGGTGADVFAAGQEVRVRGEIGDDVFAAGNLVDIEAARAGDLFAAGAQVRVAGNVSGDAYLAGAQINLAGKVDGSVRAAGESIRIGEGAIIDGDLITYGEREPEIAAGATINGTVRHEIAKQEPRKVLSAIAASWVYQVVAWFVAALMLLYLLRASLQEATNKMFESAAKSLGVGALALLIFLPLAVVLFVTIVGWPLAILVLLLTGAHLLVAHIVAALGVGGWVMRKVFKATSEAGFINWQTVLLGTVLLKAIGLLPILGGLIVLLLTLLGWGALLQVLWRRLRAT